MSQRLLVEHLPERDPDWKPEEGDFMDAVVAALDLKDIPARITPAPDDGRPVLKSEWQILVDALQQISRDMPLEAQTDEDWGDDGMGGAFSKGSDYASYIDACRARKALKAVGIKPEGDDPAPASRCDDCGTHWCESDLNEPQDLTERVAPGEPMPSGECPECGALCHPIDNPDERVGP